MAEFLEGDKELDRLLKKLPSRLLNRVVGRSATLAMVPVGKEMKRLAKRSDETGLLTESVGAKKKLYRRTETVTVNVGPRAGFKRSVDVELNEFELEFGGVLRVQTHKTMVRNPSNYAHLVEGFKSRAKPHRIVAFGRVKVDHPGVSRPKPFVRPAFDRKKEQAFRIYRAGLAKGAVREAQKLRGRA